MTTTPTPSGSTTPRLTRPRRGRMIAGVCAGIAERFAELRAMVEQVAGE